MRVEEILALKITEMQRELDDALAECAPDSSLPVRLHWFGWRDVDAMCVLLDALAEADDGAAFGTCSRRLRESSAQLRAAEQLAEQERQTQINLAGYGHSYCPYLSATDIGRIVVPALQPAEVNKALVQMGLLENTDKGWYATAAGQPYVFRQIKATPNARGMVNWKKEVLDPFMRFRRNQRAS